MPRGASVATHKARKLRDHGATAARTPHGMRPHGIVANTRAGQGSSIAHWWFAPQAVIVPASVLLCASE
jgi:hypothetical protein